MFSPTAAPKHRSATTRTSQPVRALWRPVAMPAIATTMHPAAITAKTIASARSTQRVLACAGSERGGLEGDLAERDPGGALVGGVGGVLRLGLLEQPARPPGVAHRLRGGLRGLRARRRAGFGRRVDSSERLSLRALRPPHARGGRVRHGLSAYPLKNSAQTSSAKV